MNAIFFLFFYKKKGIQDLLLLYLKVYCVTVLGFFTFKQMHFKGFLYRMSRLCKIKYIQHENILVYQGIFLGMLLML